MLFLNLSTFIIFATAAGRTGGLGTVPARQGNFDAAYAGNEFVNAVAVQSVVGGTTNV
jgi:hypothetical protein